MGVSWVGYSHRMVSVDEAKAAVVAARAAAVEAQQVFLQALAEQWRDLASQKFRALALDLQPERSEALGDRLAEVRAAVDRVIDEGADRVPDLFARATDPDLLVSQVQDRKYGMGHISFSFAGYRGPIDLLAQPLHDVLTDSKYSPDLVKSKSPKANYSSEGFTDSDFPLPSVEIQSTYAEKIHGYGKARFALAVAQKEAAAEAAKKLWDGS